MGEFLYASAKVVGGLAPFGFLAGFLLIGLLRLYDRLPRKAALPLKVLTLAPPLFLTVVGLIISLLFFFFIPYAIFWYVPSGLLAELGRRLLFNHINGSFRKRLVGGGLLAAAALPFMLVGLAISGIVLGEALGAGTYAFDIKNYSGHEIVLKKVQVSRKVLFTGEHRLYSRPEPQSLGSKDWSTYLEEGFLIKPGKIRLLVYDVKLGKEVWGKVKLPNYPKHPSCPFDIVYGPEGFYYENKICG